MLRPLDPDDIGDCDLVVAIATHADLRWRRATRGRMSLAPHELLANIRSACAYLFAVETEEAIHGLVALSDVDEANRVATVDLVVGPGPAAAAQVRAHAAPAVRRLLSSVAVRRLYFERYADEPFPFEHDAHRWQRELVIDGFAELDGVPVAYETWATTPQQWAAA